MSHTTPVHSSSPHQHHSSLNMVNTNLNDANEEIRRLKLLLGTKIDGGFEEENEDKLREGMFKRMKVMDELDELRVIREECIVASEKHERASRQYYDFVNKSKANREYRNTLHSSLEEMEKEMDETTQLEKEILQQISDARRRKQELGRDIAKKSGEWNNENNAHKNDKQSMDRLKELKDSSKGELDELTKEFREMESKFIPKKRKEMESLSGDFDDKIDISGKRNRSNSM